MALTSSLDPYVDRDSPVHALDARVKLLLTLALVLALALIPAGRWSAMIAIAALLWWAVLRSAVGPGLILRRAFIAAPFALAALTLVVTRPGAPLLRLPLGPLTLTVTDAGLVAFASVILKTWLSVQAALLLMATSRFTEVLGALRSLGLPAVLVAMLGFAYRYLFVLVDEAERLLRARDSRAAALPGRRAGGPIAWRAGVLEGMVGTLFVRAYERSERIHAAMLSRSYTGEFRSFPPRSLTTSEQGLLIAGAALLAAIVWLAYWR